MPTYEVQRRSPGQDDQRARLRARPRRSAHLRPELKTKKCPHIPVGHLSQHKTSNPSPPVDSPCVLPHTHTCGPDLQHRAAPTILRQGGQEGHAKWASGGRRALAFARRTRSSPRSFAVLSGAVSSLSFIIVAKPLGGGHAAAAIFIISGISIFFV